MINKVWHYAAMLTLLLGVPLFVAFTFSGLSRVALLEIAAHSVGVLSGVAATWLRRRRTRRLVQLAHMARLMAHGLITRDVQ